MKTEHIENNRRILIIDDSQSIQADFRKILAVKDSSDTELITARAELFGGAVATPGKRHFELTAALQGQEGLAAVQAAKQSGQPFAMAFVDIRMPPGWDGIETTARLWETDPDLQVVLCTAYSDYSWKSITARIGNSDRLVILKKPFDTVEVLQLANALTEKWRLFRKPAGEWISWKNWSASAPGILKKPMNRFRWKSPIASVTNIAWPCSMR